MATSPRTILAQGALAGLIGYAFLAALMSLVDLLMGRSPLHSAAVLGASIFYGATDPSRIEVLPAYVLAYNGAHLLVFLVLGIVAAALATLADRGRQLWYVSAVLYVFIAFHAIGAVQGLAVDVRSELSARTLWAGGLIASATMAAFLVWRHPRMRRPQAWDG